MKRGCEEKQAPIYYYIGNPDVPQTRQRRGHPVPESHFRWRAAEYLRLAAKLEMNRNELSKLTGLTINTLGQYPNVEQRQVPSLHILEIMRAEVERRN